MKRQIALILSLLMVLGGSAPYAMGNIKKVEEGDVIVKYLGNMPPKIHLKNAVCNGTYTFENNTEGIYSLAHYTSKACSTKELINAFNKLEGVVYAEANSSCHVAALPNDPYAPNQWYLSNQEIDYERSSQVDIGIESLWAKGDELEENVVAIIDTGVDYTHPDLIDNIWDNTTTLPGKHGYNFIDQNDDPMDNIGHGTHCAGIIAAKANNELGITGVSRRTKIMALKYMDETGNGMMSQAIAAYEYIIEAQKQGVNVVAISNSWENTDNPKALEDIIRSAGEKGIISVCAAGNSGANLDIEKTFPAGYNSPYTIVVAASTPDDQLASFSCYGKDTVDVAAPGTSMLSCYNREAYIPTLSNDNTILLNFEDNIIGFLGNNISITDQVAFEGTHALAWQLTPSPMEEMYIEGDTNIKYVNEITLDIPEAAENLYLGLNFWSQCPIRNEGMPPICYVEAYQNNMWMNIGRLNIESINFWNSNFFEISPGTTKLRLICTGIAEGSTLYLDDVGVGKTTGKYFYLQGTSTAAPVVTGEVAMLKRLFPNEDTTKIRARVVGGVDHTMPGMVASDGRINVKRAVENPYAVMNELIQGDNGNIKIKGQFFGINPGVLTLNGQQLEVTAWTDTEITAKYTGGFDGYGEFALTRGDGETSTQLLIINNKAYNWTHHAPMPLALKNAVAVAYGDMIYVMGGTLEDNEPSQALLAYNIKEDYWSRLTDLPATDNIASYASGSGAAGLKDKILFVTFDSKYNKNDYYVYSIKEDVWEKQEYEVVPEPREYAAVVAYDNEVYMVGGIPRGDYTGQEALSQDIWKLSKDKKWEKVVSLNEGRYAPIVAVVEDKMVITGGRMDNGSAVVSTETYDGKQIERGTDLPYAGLDRQNTVFGGGKKLYVMTDGISFESSGLIYALDTATWENSSYRLGYKRIEGVASAASNDNLYGIGGTADYRFMNSVESIAIEGNLPETIGTTNYRPYIIGGGIIIVVIVLIILIVLWLKKRRKPKKMYIR